MDYTDSEFTALKAQKDAIMNAQMRREILKRIDTLMKNCKGCTKRVQVRGKHTEHICLRECEIGKKIKEQGDKLTVGRGEKCTRGER